ncbi:MAG TPA: glycosyltransferase family 39 protein [Tepidisphaeraceae bacterium]
MSNDSGGHRGLDCAIIVAVQCLLVLLLRPFQDAPFIDDWSYAWPVEHLLRTGRLASLEYANNVNTVQVLWGSLFCLPAGFSFSALRLSTWVLATAGLCVFHLFLRDLDVRRRDALVGTALLAFNPIFFILAFSFMTDVPFVMLTLAATWAFTRAVRRASTPWLIQASILACLACGIRVVGVVWPIAAAIVLLLNTGPWGRRPGRLLLALLPLVAFVLLATWNADHIVRSADLSDLPNSPGNRLKDLREFGIASLPEMTLAAVVTGAAVLGLSLAPLSLAMIDRRGASRIAIAMVALLLLVGWMPRSFQPLASGSTWSWREIGYVDVPNRPSVPPPTWLAYPLGVMAIVSSAVVLSGIVRRKAEPILVWQIVGHMLIIAAVWLFYDRFYLIVLPPVIALMLADRPIPRPRWAVTLIAPLAMICLIGARDHLAYNRALWAGVARLHEIGARTDEIDAGYTANAWLQYAHPENAPRDEAGRIWISGFTVEDVPRYQLSDRLMPGTEVIGSVPYRRWLGSSGAIYLLRYPLPVNRHH